MLVEGRTSPGDAQSQQPPYVAGIWHVHQETQTDVASKDDPTVSGVQNGFFELHTASRQGMTTARVRDLEFLSLLHHAMLSSLKQYSLAREIVVDDAARARRRLCELESDHMKFLLELEEKERYLTQLIVDKKAALTAAHQLEEKIRQICMT